MRFRYTAIPSKKKCNISCRNLRTVAPKVMERMKFKRRFERCQNTKIIKEATDAPHTGNVNAVMGCVERLTVNNVELFKL